MNKFLDDLEQKLRGRAIPHLTAVMIGCFVLGYIMQAVSPSAAQYMSLNIYEVLHGQVWRIVTWVIIPPESIDIFTIIMLFFYFSIGTTLERTWGDARYNIYLLGGMLISLIAAFITYFIFAAFYPGIVVGSAIGAFFSTYNICMSILLAYAATFPNATVLLMFVIPLKMKYLGWVYAAFILYDCIQYVRMAVSSGNALYWIYVIAIAAAMANFLIFFLSSRNRTHLSAEQKRRQKEFRKSVENAARSGGQKRAAVGPRAVDMPGVRHRCEVCGRTDADYPDLEFRYCSKCAGEHEYCMDHLYTHVHIKPE